MHSDQWKNYRARLFLKAYGIEYCNANLMAKYKLFDGAGRDLT